MDTSKKNYYTKSNFFKRGVHFFKKLLEPKSKDENLKRKEFIANIFLMGSLLLSLSSFIIAIINKINTDGVYPGLAPSIIFIVVFIFFILYILSRKGYFIISSYILITIYLAFSVYTAYFWGVDVPQGLLIFVLVIIMSGALISTKFAFFITAFIASVLFTLSYLQGNSIISPNSYWKEEAFTTDDVLMIVFTLCIISTASWLSNREIKKSLKKVTESKKELKKERDLLEVKVLERTRELEKSQKEKELQLYRFSEFGKIASEIFHDIVNPLTAAKLNIEDLQKNNHIKSYEDELVLGKISQGIERIVKLTEVAKKQVQGQKTSRKFSSKDEIDLAVQTFSYKARKEKIELKFYPLNNDIIIYGDPVKFYRMTCTLIDNAIGSYEQIKDKRIKKIIINLKKDKNNLYIQIRDWGCGIKKENLKKIFDPLFTTKTAEKGTGLGLSVAIQIIKSEFNGKIKVKSTKNKGAKFTVCVPLRKI